MVNEIGGLLQEKGHKVDLDAKRYRLKVTLKHESEEGGSGATEEEEAPVAFNINILDVKSSADKKYCVEFNRTSGD